MKIEVKEGHGTLNFKVEWQSLDGRLRAEYHNTFLGASDHAAQLRKLGRAPQIWGMVNET